MSAINRTKLLNLVNNDEEFLKEIIQDYLEETSQKVMALNMAFFKKDIHTIQDIAISIKGSSENITATELQKAAKQLEYAAKIRDFKLGAYFLNKIEIEMEKIKEAFNI